LERACLEGLCGSNYFGENGRSELFSVRAQKKEERKRKNWTRGGDRAKRNVAKRKKKNNKTSKRRRNKWKLIGAAEMHSNLPRWDIHRREVGVRDMGEQRT